MANKNNSPQNASRGCLCKDGSYSKECCEGELINQGIGALVQQQTSSVVNTNQPRVIVRVS
jgi:hypothetical protein